MEFEQGRLNKDGVLMVKRHGQMKMMRCPHSLSVPGGGMMCCGDTCPKLGEPVKDGNVIRVNMCSGDSMFFETFHDQRQQKKEHDSNLVLEGGE